MLGMQLNEHITCLVCSLSVSVEEKTDTLVDVRRENTQTLQELVLLDGE